MPGRADRLGVTAATVDGWRKMPLANWVGKAAHFWQLVAAECETGMWPHSAGAARDLGGGCLSQRTQRHCGLTVPLAIPDLA